MIEAFVICRLIMILAFCIGTISGIAALVSCHKFYNEKLAIIFLITMFVLFGIGFIALVPMCVTYQLLKIQYLEYIGFL